MPGKEEGKTWAQVVCHLVAPSEYAAYLMLTGTVEELLLNVGDEVKEMEVIAV